jgi:hypothetical protein
MTFLLFLASLAVLQRIVSRSEKGRLPGGSPPDAAAPPDTVPDTAGLAALGRSLDRYGRGNVPSPAPAMLPLPAPVRAAPLPTQREL